MFIKLSKIRIFKLKNKRILHDLQKLYTFNKKNSFNELRQGAVDQKKCGTALYFH